MRLLDTQVVQEGHHLPREVPYATSEVPLSLDVEGHGAEAAREGGDLLEPAPPPEAHPVYQDEGGPRAADFVVYGGVVGAQHRHAVTSLAPRAAFRPGLRFSPKAPNPALPGAGFRRSSP